MAKRTKAKPSTKAGVRLAMALKKNNLKAVSTPTPHLEPVKPKAKKTSAKGSAKPRKPYVRPTTMRDGSPLIPWSEKVKAALVKRKALEAEGKPTKKDQYAKVCTALTTGIHGPQRPCENPAIKGLEVCRVHGGSLKHVKAALKRRIMEEADPTLAALIEIRDQREHMPSALGAGIHLMNRILGKPGDGEKVGAQTAPTIVVGINIGGLPAKQKASAQVKQLEAPVVNDDDDEFDEGEVVADDEDEDDYKE